MSIPAKTKILVAEDDMAVLDLVARWLEAAGYWVVKARDGERVIEAVREAAPAGIVMDLTMPKMDGFEVLTKLRAMGVTTVPVLVLTGHQSADDVRKVVSLGARDYLTKPVDRATLLVRVERLLRNAAIRARVAALDRPLRRAVAGSNKPLQQRIADSASEAGFTLATNQPAPGAGIEVSIASARPAAFFGWIAALEAQGISVRTLSAQPSGVGTISTQAVLDGR